MNGKLTLPLIWLRDKLEPAQRDKFLGWLRDPTPANVQGIIQWVKDSGAIKEGLSQAANFAQLAKAALQSFPDSTPKQTLNAIAQYIVTRTR